MVQAGAGLPVVAISHSCVIISPGSPPRLHLSYGTPVADILAYSPPLPLTINYGTEGRETTVEDEEGILLALQYRDRVRRIRLVLPASRLQNLVMTVDEESPILDRVFIRSWTEDDRVLLLPGTFQHPICAALECGMLPFQWDLRCSQLP